MLLERLVQNLAISVKPFDLCRLASGQERAINEPDEAVAHFVLSGKGLIHSIDSRLEVAAGSLVMLPPGSHHRLVAETGSPEADPQLVTACGLLTARYNDGPSLFAYLRRPLVVDFSASDEMQHLFRMMLRESGGNEAAADHMLTLLMQRCIVLLFRRLCGEDDCPLPWLSALEDEGLGAALDAMLRAPGDKHSVETLAATAMMGRSSFVTAFTEAFGAPPMTYLRQVRLRTAATMLCESDTGLTVIAHKVGFSSRAHFSTAFRQHFGMAPGEFRSTRDRVEGTLRR